MSDWARGLWLVWGCLTDCFGGWAETAMREAAQGCLDLAPDDDGARVRFLDRWVYDECGYERPSAG